MSERIAAGRPSGRCIAKHGCHLLEDVATAELASAEVCELCCVTLPARLRGASASIVSPPAALQVSP